ncbi:MAG: ABC transporter permease [Candidatus Kapaibacterium sp.]
MFNYFLRRFLLIVPTFLACTIVVFVILQVTPGGPFEMKMQEAAQQQSGGEGGGGGGDAHGGGMQVPAEAQAALKSYFDLDKPIHIRYAIWLSKMAHGDLGESYVYSQPVIDVITSRFPVSIYFGLIGFTLSYLICIPLGILKAIRHGSSFDLVSSAIVFIGFSIPGWALGAVVMALDHGKTFPLGEFRSSGWDDMAFWDQIWDQLHHTILPVICYMVGGFATLTILMKNSLMENLGQDYVRTAFAKGLSEKRVVFIHALRNSMIPIATGLGHAISLILAGSFLIEKTFNIDGIGYLGYRSAVGRDYTVVLGILVIEVALQLLGNIFSDMLYAVFDPRIRFR